jgi:hypothetical protein
MRCGAAEVRRASRRHIGPRVHDVAGAPSSRAARSCRGITCQAGARRSGFMVKILPRQSSRIEPLNRGRDALPRVQADHRSALPRSCEDSTIRTSRVGAMNGGGWYGVPALAGRSSCRLKAGLLARAGSWQGGRIQWDTNGPPYVGGCGLWWFLRTMKQT